MPHYSIRLKWLGSALNKIRREAGLTIEAAAERLHWPQSKISRIENGTQPPTEQQIRDWCTVCGTGDQIPDLLATARSVKSAYLEWFRQSRAGMRRLGDLHSILDFTNPGLVGARNPFIAQLSGGSDGEGRKGEGALRALNGILVFRRTKDEPVIAAELPDRIDELDRCAMTPEQIGLYQAVLDSLITGAGTDGEDARKGAVLAAITALLPLLAGDPVLTSLGRSFDPPLLGPVYASTTLAFDIGVYLVVVGLVFMVFEAFGDDQPHQAEAHADADADGTVRR